MTVVIQMHETANGGLSFDCPMFVQAFSAEEGHQVRLTATRSAAAHFESATDALDITRLWPFPAWNFSIESA